MKDLIATLREGGSLDPEQVHAACLWLVDEKNDVAERADFLRALHEKGESPEEVAGFVNILKEMSLPFPSDKQAHSIPRIDVCGTGGDGKDYFNVSTSAMFAAAACGARVVKQGNRSVTSQCGSADVLEALGVSIHLSAEAAMNCLDQTGAVFLFARDYYPAFRAVTPVRQLLAAQGIRTIFNIVGPLINPADPDCQLVGVFSEGLMDIYAQSLIRLGRKRAWVVCGNTNEDEISITAPTRVIEIVNGFSRDFTIDPLDLGFEKCDGSIMVGGDAARNACIIEGILKGKITDARRDAVILNAAAAVVISGIATDMEAGIQKVRKSIEDGLAMRVLERMRSF
ncbi:MAG: anthranilate phosphoribosyltransferase [Chthoniobacterales bacterium]